MKIMLDAGQEIVNWERFEKRQRAEIKAKGHKDKEGYSYKRARQRLADGLRAKRRVEQQPE